jgi:Mrp family chromosome partitioning ATPase
LQRGPGLTDVLLGKVALRDALVPYSRGLRILQVGETELNPSEALGSQAMVDLLEQASELCEIVIIDSPPVLPVADPTVLAALVDATVVVARWGRTSLYAATAARQMLENVGAFVIGVVINAEGGGSKNNYYRHYSKRRLFGRSKATIEGGLVPASPREDRNRSVASNANAPEHVGAGSGASPRP